MTAGQANKCVVSVPVELFQNSIHAILRVDLPFTLEQVARPTTLTLRKLQTLAFGNLQMYPNGLECKPQKS